MDYLFTNVHLLLTDRPMVIFVICVNTMIANYFFMTTKNNQFVFILFSVYWLGFGFWASLGQNSMADMGLIFHTLSFPIIILTFGILLEELKNDFHD